MAFYKDKNGNLVKVDVYDKNPDNLGAPTAKAKIFCIPFGVPYKIIQQTQDEMGSDSAGLFHDYYTSRQMAHWRGFHGFGVHPVADGATGAWDYKGHSGMVPWNASINLKLGEGVTTRPQIFGWNDQESLGAFYDSMWKNTSGTGENTQSFYKTALVKGEQLAWNHHYGSIKLDGGMVNFKGVDPIRFYGNFSCVAEVLPKGDTLADVGKKTVPKNQTTFKLLGPHDDSGKPHPNAIVPLVGYNYNKVGFSTEIAPSMAGNKAPGKIRIFYDKLQFGYDPSGGEGQAGPFFWGSGGEMSPGMDPTGLMRLWGDGVEVPTTVNMSWQDSTFVIEKPALETSYLSHLTEKESSSTPVKIDSHYNFFLPYYERSTSDYHRSRIKVPVDWGGDKTIPVPEEMLPNIYALIYDSLSDEVTYRYSDQGSFWPRSNWTVGMKGYDLTNLDFKKIEGAPFCEAMTSSALKKSFIKDLYSILAASSKLTIGSKKHQGSKVSTVESIGAKNIEAYLNNFVSALEKVSGANKNWNTWWKGNAAWNDDQYYLGSEGGVKSPIEHIKEKKYKITGISAYKMNDFTIEARALKKMFPYHVDIKLPMANGGPIGKILFENGLTDIFMQNVMAAMWPISSTYSNTFISAVHIKPEDHKGFYNSLKVNQSYSLPNVCLIRKDNFVQTKVSDDKQVFSVKSEQDRMFKEPLLALWLNKFFDDTDVILDLDAAQCPNPKDSPATPLAVDYYAAQEKVPPQYWDWINYSNSKGYLDQIARLQSLENGFYMTPAGPVPDVDVSQLNVLKPVIFGKAPPKANIQSLLKWVSSKKKIVNLINEVARNVGEIYNGQLAHSEVLFYEVVKHASDHNINVEGIETSELESMGLDSTIAQVASTGHGYGGVSVDISSDNAAEALKMAESPQGGPSKNPLEDKGGFIQSFFIPNVPGLDIAEYVDTQVKFDKGYYYQVYAHTLVVGTQYNLHWAKRNTNAPTYHFMDINYMAKPDVHLIRTPYYNTYVSTNNTVEMNPDETYSQGRSYNSKALETTLVWDKPPIFPDVSFLPLYGKKDKVLINVNFNTGQYDSFARPLGLGKEYHPPGISVLDAYGVSITEQQIYDSFSLQKLLLCKLSQKKLSGKITYKSDDFCGAIQVYRVDKKPESYFDFGSTTKIYEIGHGQSNFGFLDTIQPNKDYYYVFRTVDVHGSVSNPSPIYFARIVNKVGEAPYTILKVLWENDLFVDLPKNSKEFMKYISIKPSMAHGLVDAESISTYVPAPDLSKNNAAELKSKIGDESIKDSPSVFGKTFKFRFTSKKTGRKFDLNLFVKPIQAANKQLASASGELDKYSSGKC